MPEKIKRDFSTIVQKYSNSIYRLVLLHTNNRADAQDIVQETFLRYAVHVRKNGDIAHEKAWLLKVAVNLCTDIGRSPWSKGKTELEDWFVPAEEFSSESENDVYQALMRLPEKYRSVIHLYYYEGYSINEISSVTGMNTNTIKTHLSRGKKLLKEKLVEEYDYEI